MTDCPNAEIRDRLPDLLHNRLDASTRAAVMAHVDGCADCREELELLRGVRAAIVAGTPRVNVSSIVYALPNPPAVGVAPVRRRAPRVDWRLAAAVTILAVGASSLTLLSRDGGHVGRPGDSAEVVLTPRATAPSIAPSTGDSSPASPETTAQPSPRIAATQAPVVAESVASVESDAGSAARLSGLSQRQLKSLIDDIDRMQAIPVAEPEPVSITVDAKAVSARPDGI